jgi:hypothetical protein
MIESLSELNLDTIAIIDDDIENAESLGINITTCGAEPRLFTEEFGSLDDLLHNVTRSASAVLCDNRLNVRRSATFCGAEAVARWHKLRFPAILVSEFTDLDMNTTIREWRRNIPVVIPRDQISRRALIDGFAVCRQEISNNLPAFRKPRRAMVRISRLGNDSGTQYVEAFVPQWNPLKAVRFPRSLLGELGGNDLTSDMLLIADVNIGARSADELFFDDFQIAPEPDSDDGLA